MPPRSITAVASSPPGAYVAKITGSTSPAPMVDRQPRRELIALSSPAATCEPLAAVASEALGTLQDVLHAVAAADENAPCGISPNATLSPAATGRALLRAPPQAARAAAAPRTKAARKTIDASGVGASGRKEGIPIGNGRRRPFVKGSGSARSRAKPSASTLRAGGVPRPLRWRSVGRRLQEPFTNRGRSASTEIATTLMRAVGLVGPRKNLAGNTIANDNAIALAA